MTNTQGNDALKVKNFYIVHSQVPEFTIQAFYPCLNTKKLNKRITTRNLKPRLENVRNSVIKISNRYNQSGHLEGTYQMLYDITKRIVYSSCDKPFPGRIC